MSQHVYILRGIPGAGKSTWAKKEHDARVFSADDFFTDSARKYIFVPDGIQRAHDDCLHRFLKDVQRVWGAYGRVSDTLVVDNTNCTLLEVVPYLRIALACDAQVTVVDFEGYHVTAAARNVHGVPPTVVKRMADTLAAERTDKLPPYLLERIHRIVVQT